MSLLDHVPARMVVLSALVFLSSFFWPAVCGKTIIAVRHDRDYYWRELDSQLDEISTPRSTSYGLYYTKSELDQYLAKAARSNVYALMRHLTFMHPDAACMPQGDLIVCQKSVGIPQYLEKYIDLIEDDSVTYNPEKGAKTDVEAELWISNQPSSGFVGRESIFHTYNVSSDYMITSGATIAPVEFQGYPGIALDDIEKNCKLNGITAPTSINMINQEGSGTGTESQLDIQMQTLVAAGANFSYVSETGWLLSFTTNMLQLENPPEVVSLSYGWNEYDQCQFASCTNNTKYVIRMNHEFMKLALRGMTILASSGDAGAPGRTNEGCSYTNSGTTSGVPSSSSFYTIPFYSMEDSVGVNDYAVYPTNAVYPTSSPYVLSVGATYGVNKGRKSNMTSPICKKYGCIDTYDEWTTSFEDTEWTAGGGFSRISPQPAWQKKEVADYLKVANGSVPSSFNARGRAYPDVAAFGHNCAVVMYGGLSSVDGTSCSAPVFAGIVAILNDYQKLKGRPVLGYANTLFYQMAAEWPDTFNRVKMPGYNWCTEYDCCGPNSGFKKFNETSWDPVTGLGTPNVGRMMEYLDYVAADGR